MKRLAAVALVLVSMAAPLCAQRGSAHGGFSGHGSSGIHGGFSAPAARGFAGSGGRIAGRPYLAPRGLQRSGSGVYNRSPYTGGSYTGGSWRYRHPYISPYRQGYAYGAGGWVTPYYLGDPDYGYDSGDNGDVQTSQNASPEGYGQSPYDQEPPPYPSYLSYPQAPAAAPGAVSPAVSEDAVTLIFKDGRPPEQIRNFILTPGTLYVGGDHRREISVDQIDLAATAKVNRDAGVEFQLPAASR
jgi:hypothetical protein